VANSSGSCIDHVLSKFPDKISAFSSKFSGALSDHCFLSFSYCLRPPTPVDQFVSYRDISRVDIEFLQEQVSLAPWGLIYATADVDEQVSVLTDLVKGLYESCVPIRRRFVPDPSTPWMTLRIRNAIRDRNRLRVGSDEFRFAKRHVEGMIRDAIGRDVNRKFDPSLPQRVIWSNFRHLGLADSSDFSSLGVNADDFANFFSNINAPSVSVPFLPDDDSGIFSFRTIDIVECTRAFELEKSNAVGCDGISIKFVMLILPFISGHILHVFNHAITTSTFPALWKEAIVRPVAKVQTPTGPSDFRPISILPVFAKAFERVLHDQILAHVTEQGFLTDFQSGFRKGHSTITALVKVTEDLRVAMEKGLDSMLGLLDFSKAFDCVNHGLFIFKLRALYSFHKSAGALMASFLDGRSMSVEVDGVRSSTHNLSSGVPQGSILSPLSFALFINDLHRSLNFSKFHFYADDLQVYISGERRDIALLADKLNQDLASVHRWSIDNGLLLNSRKSQGLFVSSSLSSQPLPSLFLGQDLIEWSDQVKDLGMLLDSRLRFSYLVTNICSKVYGTLHRLRLLKYLTPKHIRFKLCKALLLPIFFYSDVIYSDLLSMYSTRLQVAFNSCTRYVFGLKLRDPFDPFRNALLGLPLSKYFDFRVVVFFFKIIFNKRPFYLYSQLSRGSERTMNYLMPTVNPSGSVLVRGIKLYNSLPIPIRRSGSVANFESRVFEWMKGQS
jgi:hypothetical protein